MKSPSIIFSHVISSMKPRKDPCHRRFLYRSTVRISGDPVAQIHATLSSFLCPSRVSFFFLTQDFNFFPLSLSLQLAIPDIPGVADVWRLHWEAELLRLNGEMEVRRLLCWVSFPSYPKRDG